MLLPRAYTYATSSPQAVLDEKRSSRQHRDMSHPRGKRKDGMKASSSPPQTTRAATPPIPVRTPDRKLSAQTTLLHTHSAPATRRRQAAAHDASALPPSVAALLAVTQIPRPKPSQFRRYRAKPERRISIDELVNEWKNDTGLATSCSASPTLAFLLDDGEEEKEPLPTPRSGVSFPHCERSTSSDSVPSLDADDRSVFSNNTTPSTPGSLRSRKSISTLRRVRSRSVAPTEECTLDHPLAPTPHDDVAGNEFALPAPYKVKKLPPKPKSSFTSNLTTSLQALKTAALNSISSLSKPTAQQRRPPSPFSDDVLWSHPFLFPRLSPEIRPATPDLAPHNPQTSPLTFEEQEAPFQLALHAPYLAQQRSANGAPTIQMTTYNKRKAIPAKHRGGVDPESELGRAVLGAAGVRQRELRENSDFLRVVVLEMNMKREGKLEMGKARIWLPPRRDGIAVGDAGRRGKSMPSRWVGVSAY